MQPLKNKDEVKTENIFWDICLQQYAYTYNDEYVCYFDYKETPTDAHLGMASAFGVFSLYKLFRMSNGNLGVDRSNLLKEIYTQSYIGVLTLREKVISKNEQLDEFKQSGIFKLINYYLQNEKTKE